MQQPVRFLCHGAQRGPAIHGLLLLRVRDSGGRSLRVVSADHTRPWPSALRGVWLTAACRTRQSCGPHSRCSSTSAPARKTKAGTRRRTAAALGVLRLLAGTVARRSGLYRVGPTRGVTGAAVSVSTSTVEGQACIVGSEVDEGGQHLATKDIGWGNGRAAGRCWARVLTRRCFDGCPRSVPARTGPGHLRALPGRRPIAPDTTRLAGS